MHTNNFAEKYLGNNAWLLESLFHQINKMQSQVSLIPYDY